MNYIELFAGCGGLSLGLEASGYNLVFANELSPMASETYSYNFFNEHLNNKFNIKHTLWINSNYSKMDIHKRLRENPKDYPILGDSGFSDISKNTVLNHKLIVGSITELNKLFDIYPSFLDQIKTPNLPSGLDLVSGGPPCQSFSMAGLRQVGNERNTLPWEFVKFVEKSQPKFVLLENVTGILKAFKIGDGRFYAWYEVAKAFASIDYIPLCLHINAKYVGVPQSRPRFILLAIRLDVYRKIFNKFNLTEKNLFENSYIFFEKVKINPELEFGHLGFYDVDKSYELFSESFLKPLVLFKNYEVTVQDAIQDLAMESSSEKSDYVFKLNRLFNPFIRISTDIYNHEFRSNGIKVQKRFKLYQNLNKVTKETKKEVKKILNGSIFELSEKAFNELQLLDFLDDDSGLKKFHIKSDLVTYLMKHETKKRTQKSLIPNQPAPTTLSIPDDVCHYSDLRTLTVREMARIQSFPDNFRFLSKVTTGGQMRKFEVPQYTQVGNAVPPLLGYQLGQTIKYLIDLYKN